MPAVARAGDAGVIHCSAFKIAQGSNNVSVNGKPAARVGDKNTLHKNLGKKCPPHITAISKGSRSVYVNNRPLARVGDSFAQCTRVAQGSPNVFAG
jgi:uncharacterized Zn-binding protein involved in type VI secretion